MKAARLSRKAAADLAEERRSDRRELRDLRRLSAPAPIGGALLESREHPVDTLEQLCLLRRRRHSHTHELVLQPHVGEDTSRVVVEVEERAGLELEAAGASLTQHGTRAQRL